MFAILHSLGMLVADLFKPRCWLEAENLSLPKTRFEHSAEHSVVVANEIFWGAVPWKRFRDLARQPVGRRIAGHRKPQQPSPLVAQNQKCEQPLKRNRRNHK